MPFPEGGERVRPVPPGSNAPGDEDDWAIVRIWSMDWVKDPNAQIERVLVALERARNAPPRPAVPRSRSVPLARRADESPVKAASVVKKLDPPEGKHSFDKIDDVPESLIEKLVLTILGTYGATEEDDLKQAVSRQLGFKRTGKNIVARLELSIESLIRAKKLHRAEGDSLKLNGDQSRNSA